MRNRLFPIKATILLLTLAPLAFADPPQGYVLRWSDEFDGARVDPAKWKVWLPGKRRDAFNTADAVGVADGKLTITTYTEGGRHCTAMVATEGLFERAFGYWEARIQWQDAPATWSVFWIMSDLMMLPRFDKHLGDVARAGNELDIVEHRELDKTGRRIAGKAAFTLHWDGYGPQKKYSEFVTDDLGLDRGFHTYGCEWTETGYRFYIDGKMLWETPGPVSKRPQFAVLSTEVEDGFWAWRIPKEGYGDRASSKVKMVVDYVRYYAK